MNNAITNTKPRADLAMRQQGSMSTPAFESMGQIADFARAMATSDIGVRKHLRGNVGACMAVCLQSQRWGMDPFMVANKSYLVNDQIAYESQLIAAVVNTRAPIKGRLQIRYDGQGDKLRCTVSATFDGDSAPVEVTSPELSRITPKNSPLWKTDPEQQLAYYTQRLFARRHCPEVLLGVYSEDELDREAPRGPDAARDVTPPRPKRSDYEQAPVISVNPRLDPVPVEPPPAFTLITASGEVLTWDDETDGDNVAETFADELKAGGRVVWDDNAALRDALINAGVRLPDAPMV